MHIATFSGLRPAVAWWDSANFVINDNPLLHNLRLCRRRFRETTSFILHPFLCPIASAVIFISGHRFSYRTLFIPLSYHSSTFS